MKATAVKTELITAGATALLPLLERVITELEEGSVIAITSKIVSLCEGSVIPLDQIDKEELVVRESDLYLPASVSKYGHHFTITNNTLIPMAGVDESNGDGNYVLWPKDAQCPHRTALRPLPRPQPDCRGAGYGHHPVGRGSLRAVPDQRAVAHRGTTPADRQLNEAPRKVLRQARVLLNRAGDRPRPGSAGSSPASSQR